jgi:hypothetical protein
METNTYHGAIIRCNGVKNDISNAVPGSAKKNRANHEMAFVSRAAEQRIFKLACDGYGFEEIEQTADGLYCTGCQQVHHRPIKMYSNGQNEVLCKSAVVRFYNPEISKEETKK